MRPPSAALLLLAGSLPVLAQEPAPPAPPKEEPAAPATDRALPHHPGGIAWEKDLDAAQAAAAKDGRPVAAYFTFAT